VGSADETSQTSERKKRANRQNAQKSTGPKTEQGKGYSRMNAYKHGFFANAIFHTAPLLGDEDRDEYNNLFLELCEELRPVGKLEEIQVETIVTCLLQLKRVHQFETSERTIGHCEVYDAIGKLQRSAEAMNVSSSESLAIAEEAVAQLESTGEAPPGTLERLFACDPMLDAAWPEIEQLSRDALKEFYKGTRFRPHWIRLGFLDFRLNLQLLGTRGAREFISTVFFG
jgi:hypothetical protein